LWTTAWSRKPEFHTAWSNLQALTLHRPSFVARSETAKKERVSSNMTILDIDISRGGNPKALLWELSMPDSVCRLQTVQIVNGCVRAHGADGFVGFLERHRNGLASWRFSH
jgi:hypothetical protein